MPDPVPDRRSFLARVGQTLCGLTCGNWLRRLGTAAGLTALSTFLYSWRSLPLDEQRVPVWHPECSGFNGSRGLVLRLALDTTTAKETVLRGVDARAWCLCGGVLSEAEIARRLAKEEHLTPARARRRVGRLLYQLYQAGYLLPASAAELVASRVHEVECPHGTGEDLCRQHTS